MKDNWVLDKCINFLNEIEDSMKKYTIPRCFHCGIDYIKDIKHSGTNHNTWKPNCTCLNKPTIRIVTGGKYE